MLFSGALGKLFPADVSTRRFFVIGSICGAVPDFDVIGMWAGIPYESVFGHRGFSHSILFAALLAFLVMAAAFSSEQIRSKRFWAMWSYFFVATVSHPILDAMTTGGLGVAFFSPFSNARYFFPYRPIRVSPIGIGAFISARGLSVLRSELVYIWIPSLLVVLLAGLARRRRKVSE
ncbi:MAG: metal-dependent hydrolase [Bacteroidota bacterium]